MQEKDVFFSTNKYESLTDEDIVTLVKNGDEKALTYLLEKYKELVNIKVGRYFLIGAEREDIMQEGMIGLFKAIKSFDKEKQNSFKSFANICIERQLITAIKTSNRQKHMPLNSYLSLNMNAYDNEEDGNKSNTDMIDILNTHLIEDPLDTITQKEYYQIIEETINNTLSDFEKKVLNYYMQGESYTNIAEKLDAPVKSIDNAIQRIRKKAMKEIQNDSD